jgi:hypothetical protein
LTANFASTKSYIGSASNNALQFTFGSNIGPDGNLYIAALGGGGNGGFNIQNGYSDGIVTVQVPQSILLDKPRRMV